MAVPRQILTSECLATETVKDSQTNHVETRGEVVSKIWYAASDSCSLPGMSSKQLLAV